MNNFIKQYANIWGDDPKKLMSEYNYQSDLTSKLDHLSAETFDREILYEIVLWKLNRFPDIDDNFLEDLKILASLQPKQHRKSLSLLKRLLSFHGIRIAMASTIFRFLNPNVFQIIDDRAFRVVCVNKKIPTKPLQITEKYLDKSCEVYFDYIDRLHEICNDELPFKEADRILYLLDIKLGNKIGD